MSALATTSNPIVTPQAEPVQPERVTSLRTWIAVAGANLGSFMAVLNIQIVNASLADIQGAIGAGIDDGGWISTSYLIAEIIVIPLSAWLARVFSVRRYLLVNAVLFLVSITGSADIPERNSPASELSSKTIFTGMR